MNPNRERLLNLAYASLGVALALGFFLYRRHYFPVQQQLAAAGIHYDYSIKAIPGQPIQVARAIDGDTIELINGERLRYIGIDTPEEFDQRKPVQCYAAEAAARNHQLVAGQTVTFYPDVATQDKYGRWLGFVYLPDGTFVNLTLVAEGYAFAYPYKPDISKKNEFATAERAARGGALGLWSHCTVTRLSTGREQTNPVGAVPK